MLNICCVYVGTKYSPEYVEILYSMVRRNLAAGTEGRFVVFTDNPAAFKDMAGVEPRLVPEGLEGWWAKLYLFSDEAFKKGERVLYFDLDTVITGPLDDIAKYDGWFAILEDVYRFSPDHTCMQSSVMAWEAGKLSFLWRKWVESGYPHIDGGDQQWIENNIQNPYQGIWQKLYPGLFRSYKQECSEFVPHGTSVVFFHGNPRPHEVKTGWVPEVWKISNETMFFALNVKEDQIRSNVRHALTKDKWIEMRDGLQTPCIIVGGGPSLENDLWRIRGFQLSGYPVFATNNTWKYLKDNGITPDAQIMHDARQENLPFVAPEGPCYFASQCHPNVLDAAEDRLICWHPHSQIVIDEIGNDTRGNVMVSGGSTIGLNAIALAYILGYRTFLLFGFDSSYADGAHHAYKQTLNDGELMLPVEIGENTLYAAPWMIQQAEQFCRLYQYLTDIGCDIQIYGDGLLPRMAAQIKPNHSAADDRARSLMEWLKDIENPVGAEIGVFAGDLSKRLLSRKDLTLYLVDSWSTDHSDSYRATHDFHTTLTKNDQNQYMEITRRSVKFAGDRAIIIRKSSIEAAKAIPDGSLDFVFIDADHSYEGCKADIEAWMPKIRKGGFISGHDYDNPEFEFGVKRIVDEMFNQPILGDNFTWKVNL